MSYLWINTTKCNAKGRKRVKLSAPLSKAGPLWWNNWLETREMIQRHFLGSAEIHSPAGLCYCCAHKASGISAMDTSLAPWMQDLVIISLHGFWRAWSLGLSLCFQAVLSILIAPCLPCHWKPVYSYGWGLLLVYFEIRTSDLQSVQNQDPLWCWVGVASGKSCFDLSHCESSLGFMIHLRTHQLDF